MKVAVGVTVTVGDPVEVAVGVAVSVAVTLEVADGVDVGSAVGVSVTVGVAVGLAVPAPGWGHSCGSQSALVSVSASGGTRAGQVTVYPAAWRLLQARPQKVSARALDRFLASGWSTAPFAAVIEPPREQ